MRNVVIQIRGRNGQLEAREVMLSFALKWERILFVENEGGGCWHGSRSGHILHPWTCSSSCLLAD